MDEIKEIDGAWGLPSSGDAGDGYTKAEANALLKKKEDKFKTTNLPAPGSEKSLGLNNTMNTLQKIVDQLRTVEVATMVKLKTVDLATKTSEKFGQLNGKIFNEAIDIIMKDAFVKVEFKDAVDTPDQYIAVFTTKDDSKVEFDLERLVKEPKVTFVSKTALGAADSEHPTLDEFKAYVAANVNVKGSTLSYTGTDSGTDENTHAVTTTTNGDVIWGERISSEEKKIAFLSKTNLNATDALHPTTTEVTTYVAGHPELKNSVTYYTGTDSDADNSTHVYWVTKAGTVLEIEKPSEKARPLFFISKTSLAAADTDKPTEAEFKAYLTAHPDVSDTFSYYTGTDDQDDPTTFVAYTDKDKRTVLVERLIGNATLYEVTDHTTPIAGIKDNDIVIETTTNGIRSFISKGNVLKRLFLLKHKVADTAELKGIHAPSEGQILQVGDIVKKANLYIFDATNDTGEKPTDGTPGSWVRIKSTSVNLSFLSATTLAAVDITNPTMDEFNVYLTAHPELRDSTVYYTGTDTDTDITTHAVVIDEDGKVISIERPQRGMLVADIPALGAVKRPYNGQTIQLEGDLPVLSYYTFNTHQTQGIPADDGTQGAWKRVNTGDIVVIDKTKGGAASASSIYDNENTGDKAIDDDPHTYGFSTAKQTSGSGQTRIDGQWLRIKTIEKFIPDGFTFYRDSQQVGGWNSDDYSPLDWEFQVSEDDGVTWTTLTSYTDGLITTNATKRFFKIDPIVTKKYDDYRFLFHRAVRGDYVQLTEVEIVESDVAERPDLRTYRSPVATIADLQNIEDPNQGESRQILDQIPKTVIYRFIKGRTPVTANGELADKNNTGAWVEDEAITDSLTFISKTALAAADPDHPTTTELRQYVIANKVGQGTAYYNGTDIAGVDTTYALSVDSSQNAILIERKNENNIEIASINEGDL